MLLIKGFAFAAFSDRALGGIELCILAYIIHKPKIRQKRDARDTG